MLVTFCNWCHLIRLCDKESLAAIYNEWVSETDEAKLALFSVSPLIGKLEDFISQHDVLAKRINSEYTRASAQKDLNRLDLWQLCRYAKEEKAVDVPLETCLIADFDLVGASFEFVQVSIGS